MRRHGEAGPSLVLSASAPSFRATAGPPGGAPLGGIFKRSGSGFLPASCVVRPRGGPHRPNQGNATRTACGSAAGEAAMWRDMIALDAVETLNHEGIEQEHAKQTRKVINTVLGRQVQVKRIVREKEAQNDREWGVLLREDANRYTEEEKIRRQRAVEANVALREERDVVIAARRNARAEERELDLRMERDARVRLDNALRKDAAEKEEKLMTLTGSLASLATERKRSMQERAQMRIAEKQEDKVFSQTHAKVLEAQEKQRREYLEKVKSKKPPEFDTDEVKRKNMSFWQQAQVDHEKALRHTQRLVAEEALERQRREKKQRDEILADKERIQLEKQQKKLQLLQEREEELRIARGIREAAEASEAEERERKRAVRAAAAENAAFLATQRGKPSSIVPGKFGFERMSTEELAINRERADLSVKLMSSPSMSLLKSKRPVAARG
eukprot:TRINITY_DN32021_c0_g1_i1.p1 TRINITY_DN32021_c0_g1~~TRINITY_DN32021_c0_g1_i1.p1  ORF type:complete len:443 (-),score=97.59 TRINITY_DN32021_c0_g1_i1:33-1361(-)